MCHLGLYDYTKQVDYLFKKHFDALSDSSALYIYAYFSFQEQVRMKEDSKYNKEMTAKAKVLRAYKRTVEAILKPLFILYL